MYLTKRQKDILEFLKEYIEKHGYAPSIKEISDNFGSLGPASISRHLDNLDKKGFIRKDPKKSRSITLIESPSGKIDVSDVPILGVFADGSSIETLNRLEFIKVSPHLTTGKHVYSLRVKGNSLEDVHIIEGDFLIIEARNQVEDGEMAIILLEGEKILLRRIYKENGKLILRPPRASDSIIFIEEKNINIQGIVIGVFREVTRTPNIS